MKSGRNTAMTDNLLGGTYSLGKHTVRRLGYGAMQLAGPNAFGAPQDKRSALAVLREAASQGVNHIDTSDAYGPHVTNELIREALHPYREGLLIVTKVGGARGPSGSWESASSAAEIEQQVRENLKNLGLEALDVVNLRVMMNPLVPVEGSIEAPLTALAELQRRGLVRHIGLSNVTAAQVAEGRKIADIVCVQNLYNIAHRHDDALIDELAASGIAYVPFFPLGGFSPLQSRTLNDVAARLGATPTQVALAWLLQRAPNVVPIPGTSSLTHLRENLASATLTLGAEDVALLNQIAENR
jgi:pyridoxine 4-dehydrogenase